MIAKDIKVGITQGDPNGIGLEVILKTFADNRMLELCIPVVYGSLSALKVHQKELHADSLQFNMITNAEQAKHNHPNFLSVGNDDFKPTVGVGTKEGGLEALAALERAIGDMKSGAIDVLVTAPINKDFIQSDQFQFPGHTEYLATKDGKEESLMFLVSERVRIAVATGHIPVSKVSEKLTPELLSKKILAIENSLMLDFSISKPKIAVMGLNPHAGDNGLLGSEDLTVVAPVVSEMKAQGKLVFGPFSSDGFFGSGAYRQYDAVIAMYHDQGLIPFKTLAFGSGTNFTAGLSFIRTSPDHGTGYDIASKGIADESSIRQAIFCAIDIYKNRTMNHELMANPLVIKKHRKEKSWVQ